MDEKQMTTREQLGREAVREGNVNTALASLFITAEVPVATFEPGSVREQVYRALERLHGRGSASEIAIEARCTLSQAQCAMRHARERGLVTIREVPRGIGRTFEYLLPGVAPSAPDSFITRIMADLLEHGPSNAAEIAERLDTPVRAVRTGLSYAFTKRNLIGLSRKKILGKTIWSNES